MHTTDTTGELGYPVLSDYQRAFQKHSWGNNLYAMATFHLLMGQLPNIRDLGIKKGNVNFLDPRVHVCYLSPSATGKGAGASFVATMAKRLELKYQEADKLTDNALIGTLVEDEGGGFKVDPGWLHPRWGLNILAMTEATMILQERPGPHTQNLMNILQKSMNPMGSTDNKVTKKIGFGEPIEVNPQSSLFLTTYVPHNLSEIILNRGLMQRMLLLVNRTTLSERRESSKRGLEVMADPPDTSELEASIAERMLRVNRYYRNTDDLVLTDAAIRRFKKSTERLYEEIQTTGPYFRERLGEFVTRFENLRVKLALHLACLNLHDDIQYEDAHQASVHTKFFFQDIVAYLEDAITVPDEFEDRLNRMKRVTEESHKDLRKHIEKKASRKGLSTSAIPEGVPRKKLVKHITRNWDITRITAEHYLDSLKDYGFSTEVEKQGRTWVSFNGNT